MNKTKKKKQNLELKFLNDFHSFPNNDIDVNISSNLHGWLQPSNQILLHKYIKTIKPKIILELGTWLGKSATFMCNHSSKSTIIICVDMWEGDKSIGYTTEYNGVNLYKQFLTNMKPYNKRIFPLKMDGRRAIKYLYDNKIIPDMIYLDMGHTYEDVKGDLNMILKYYNNVPILGDDYNYYDTTRHAVIETRIKYNIPFMDVDGNCYAFIWNPPIFHTKIPKINTENEKNILYKYRERITYYGNKILYSTKQSAISNVPTIFNNFHEFVTGKNVLLSGIIIYIPENYNKIKYPEVTHPPVGIISICYPEYSVDLMCDLGILIMDTKIYHKLIKFIGENFNLNMLSYNAKTSIKYFINFATIMQQIPIQYLYINNRIKELEWGRNKYKKWIKQNEKNIYLP